MAIELTPLGRETPYQIASLDDALLVTYHDGLALFRAVENGRFELELEHRTPVEASAAVKSRDGWRILLTGGSTLTVVDESLCVLESTPCRQEEDLVDLVVLNSDSFLSVNEGGGVTFWRRDEQGSFQPGSHWVVECTPIARLGKGSTVLCSERGRLQERDARNGTILKSWPKTASAAWGTPDPTGSHVLTVEDSGHAHLWEVSGRELLFQFSLDFQAVRGCFGSTGLEGAILGSGGEVALFRVVDGGVTVSVPVPQTPPVSLVYHHTSLVGVDENGGLWKLGEDKPTELGGAWAGWATCSCYRGADRIFVGTASGSVETFNQRGRRALPPASPHQDAVVALEDWNDHLISVGADATVCRASEDGETLKSEQITEFAGQSVVDHSLCRETGVLWLGLEEGLVAWLSLDDPRDSGEFQLTGRRIEEIQAAGAGAAIILTDRGSIRHLHIKKGG